MKKIFFLLLGAAAFGIVAAFFVTVVTSGSPEVPCEDCVIKGVESELVYPMPHYGDLWASTLTSDGSTYFLFGDGTGGGQCLPTAPESDEELVYDEQGCLDMRQSVEDPDEFCRVADCDACFKEACPFTQTGLVKLSGEVGLFASCDGPFGCLHARDVPYGDERINQTRDKPSSVVAVGSRMIAAMHYPPGITTDGYLAYSDTQGTFWEVLPGSPWGEQSPFRVLMFLQAGASYELNEDGYLYALGTPHEVSPVFDIDPLVPESVYLARVKKDLAVSYGAYEYLVGYDDDGAPIWGSDQVKAVALDGLYTLAQGSFLYHPDLDRYLFMSGFADIDFEAARHQRVVRGEPNPAIGVLFEAMSPWGPWNEVGRFPGGATSSFLPHSYGPNHLYYANGGNVTTYQMNIHRLDLFTE